MHKKALFIDRDGVINVDYGYISKIKNFEFVNGIFPLLRLFLKHDYVLFIVTNQSGIGREYYSNKDFETLTAWMLSEFKKHNITITSVEHCPHSPEEGCTCRKPSTGMVDRLLKQHNVDLKHSWLIGDKQSDIDLAHNAHIAHTIAIGERPIRNTSYHFKTILQCKEYLEENQGKILL